MEDKQNPSTINRSNHVHPRLDTGWAWIILTANFMISILQSGVFSSLGVFLVVWQEQLSESVTKLQWTFCLGLGIPMLIGPITSALCKFSSIRQVVMIGTVITSVAFFAAWFATSISYLYITFAAAGIGFGFTLLPSTVILAYYFDKRLARANGVSMAGIGVGMFALPPLFQVLIDQYGWNGALLIISGLVANTAVFGALYRLSPLEIKSRSTQQPQTEDKTRQLELTSQEHQMDSADQRKSQNRCHRFLIIVVNSFNFNLLMNVRFFLLFLANFPYALGYVIVLQYLPARAVHGGISEIKAAFLVSILGITSIVARFTHGYLIDYNILSAAMLTSASFFVSAVSSAMLQISNRYPVLAFLSALLGISSGVYNATVLLVAKDYVGVKFVSGALGLMLMIRSAGIFVGLFLPGVLVDYTGSYTPAFLLAGAAFLVSSVLLFVDPLVQRFLRRSEDDSSGISMQLGHESTNYERGPELEIKPLS